MNIASELCFRPHIRRNEPCALAFAALVGVGACSCAETATEPPPSGAAFESAERGDAMSSVLSDAEQQALLDALEDEYRAWATYDQVIRDFGAERPFIDIRDAESRHIEALRTLFERYGLDMPENTWPGRVPRFASTREACGAGAEAEVANVALYERLIQSAARPDILAVFANLQRASQERHLPAFRRCATRGAGRGARRG
jgi:hypothetical protein